ncbi:EI24 domain-containing protein [Epilithonimonas arachidiradicis]|uniref:Etoposide-induced protein 2.4 (EI24) n=1 Tax=Epilithonimonas arachidiradicis TaxID=1617282 RepID=A0A420DDF1_9FLAO|nr:EI24 domain-containing protein [Epilithonimonas arachidiradicis]RKE89958.1 etoposide-induced protein 2.4 (EI24) [Epilithonimonas arachidiradicis]GGG46605.1 hypothetical protein GCM10007332_05180 [Epilithonimonas arachidiradicis]
MQLYQERKFGNLISDTFTFFKEYGKNYFKNYFALNGILLLLFVIIFIFGYREFFLQLMNANVNGDTYFFQAYFQNNSLLLILGFAIFFILILALSIIMYAFPVLYMKRVAETGDKNVKPDQMLSDIRKNVGKMIIFFLGMLFIVTPLMLIMMAISSFLMIIIIGFFLLILLMPAFVNIVNHTLFDYLSTKRGFFDSLSYAMRVNFADMFDSRKAKFWKYWGSTVITFVMVYVVLTIFTMIPYMIMIFGFATIPQMGTQQDPTQVFSGGFGIFMFLMYGISILVTFVLYNVMYVNAGLQYYDSRTDLHRNLDLNEIDTIGQGEI